MTDPPEFKLSRKGGEYVGKRSKSISGFPCATWLSHNESSEILLPGFSDEVDASHRFCRNPNGQPHGPWCYVDADAGPEWEYCDVPFFSDVHGERCDVRIEGHCVHPRECKMDVTGLSYTGRKNVTIKGHQCQRWMSNFPNDQLLFGTENQTFPDDLHLQHNFCRNPTGDEGGPWCYKSNGIGLDYCDIPICY
ncbi:unnamed protein product [Darwinula stevensoni]|uniref:Kringle domain-containing protein n=1 Tax=Darwinula stevensoni TaxID=69355 RepID=A0A7R9AG60_9CRUS|nr:unnamed protein product [Darwinula stevensoni]CAG0903663.1 unnamed protein product [Darwinula stevensoni]